MNPTRRVSEPYQGPHAVFSREELIAIKRKVAIGSRTDTVLAAIARKIEAALNADPKFREPNGDD